MSNFALLALLLLAGERAARESELDRTPVIVGSGSVEPGLVRGRF
ncbi:MAG: hypothetical protein BWY79_00537 [Actinobacteria bacterium ADurb.Bin444]|nr:MAG: hypothetical protein BWY79_00537 [Actinobacteria bacterium ADurb.Bin444]